MLTLPRFLNPPAKLLPLIEQFNNFRYFLIKGGRGGAKSQTIGRFSLYLNEKYNLRTVCGRETQTSIAESVYSLLADLIREHQLNFETLASKITSRDTSSTINFRGFREQGAFNIQGMEGIDLLWIDEAQALTKQTLDVLIPTIRKNNAKIIFSMNPHVHDDPVVTMLAGRPDCLVIEINYLDNPYCPQALINEANACRKLSEKDYQHIWLGKPLDQSEDAVYSLGDFEIGRQNAHLLAQGYGVRVGGFDIARSDPQKGDTCAAFVFQQMGALHWEEVFVDEWSIKDLNYTTGRILTIINEQKIDYAVIDEDGLGAGPLDTLTRGRSLENITGFRNPSIGYQADKFFGNIRTKYAYKFKNALVSGHRHIKTKKVIDECLTIKYGFDHNQRRILVSKDKMRKEGVKSPNMADALIMAESLIGQVKEKQDAMYEPNLSQYSKEDNLFGIAGIR